MLSARTLVLLALAFAVLVFLVYSRSLGFQFILDDHRFTSDPRIQESGHIWDYFADYVWAQFVGGPSSFYRPVFVLWVRANFVLSGLSPWGWHLLSIAKHIFVAALLGTLVWTLLRDWMAAFAAATLFALHPAQSESVSWVTVPDPLMAAGILSALLLYLKYAGLLLVAPEINERKTAKKPPASARKRSPLWLAASALAYAAALFSKETAIIFPVVIFAIALCLGAPQGLTKDSQTAGESFGARLARALRHTAPFVFASALYLVLRFSALGGKLASATQHLPLRTLILSLPATLWFYVKVMLWPVRSYSFADPALVERFFVRGFLLPFLALSCCAAFVATASFWTWRRAQQKLGPRQATGVKVAIITGTLLLLLPLLPALDLNALNPGDFLHGRYTYLPLAGLMLLLASAWRLLKNFKVVLLGAAGVLTIAFAALTFSQEMQWSDDTAVFTTAHRLAPHNAPVAQNLADVSVQAALKLGDEGRCSEAIPVLNGVLQDYPEDWFAWAGLGVCYVQMNDLPRAEQSLHRAADISHNPRVIQQWQALRAHMGLSAAAPAN